MSRFYKTYTPPNVLEGAYEAKVKGLRAVLLPSDVRTYHVQYDKKGNILRDKRGLPLLGNRIELGG